jgi:hypothetical protein
MNLSGIARSRVRMIRSFLWPSGGRRRSRARGWAVVLGPLVMMVFFFWAGGQVFAQLDAVGMEVEQSGAALALFYMAAVAALWIADLHHVVTSLLLDSDLELLMRTPISRLELLLLKLVDSLPRTTPAIFGLALPFGAAFGLTYGVPAWAWALLPLQLAALWATPIGLGAAGGILLGRLVSGRKARETLALFSTLTLLLLWALNAIVMPRFAAGLGHDRLRAALTPPAWLVAISPAHWAARAMIAAANSDPVQALRHTVPLLAVAAASLLLAGASSSLWLEEALARAAGDARGTKKRRGGRLPGTAWRALILKDARLLFRDWPVIADLVVAAVLWTVLPLLFSPIRHGPALLTGRTMFLAMAVALGYEVGCRMVPFERAGLAWSRLSPIAPRRWNAIKLAGAAAISLPLLLAAAVAIRLTLPLGWGAWLGLLSDGLSALAAALAVGLWTGWTFADGAWTNPRAMLTLGGRVVATMLLLAQAGLWFVALTALDALAPLAPPGLTWWGPPALALLVLFPVLEAAAARMRRTERF